MPRTRHEPGGPSGATNPTATSRPPESNAPKAAASGASAETIAATVSCGRRTA